MSTDGGDEVSSHGFSGRHQQGSLEQKRKEMADTPTCRVSTVPVVGSFLVQAIRILQKNWDIGIAMTPEALFFSSLLEPPSWSPCSTLAFQPMSHRDICPPCNPDVLLPCTKPFYDSLLLLRGSNLLTRLHIPSGSLPFPPPELYLYPHLMSASSSLDFLQFSIDFLLLLLSHLQTFAYIFPSPW